MSFPSDVGDVFIDLPEAFPHGGIEFVFYAILTTVGKVHCYQ